MLRPGAQLPKNPGDQQPRVRRLIHHVVESAADRGTALVGRGHAGRYRDEHPPAEVRLGAQPGGQHGNGFHMAQEHDDHFKSADHLV